MMKKKKKRQSVNCWPVWPGLAWSGLIIFVVLTAWGVEQIDTQSESEATVIRGGNGMAVMAQHKELNCVGCLTEGLTD